MESQQTPRGPEDPVVGRGSPMVKQNPVPPGPGYQPRPQGHPAPPQPRYPINNGSAGGPRLGGGQQGPILHRLDSRSSLGSPTGPGGQFVQARPPFGPPRPQLPQGPVQGPVQGPRPPPTNPQGHPVAGPRYPGVPGSPTVRPPPQSPGSRPPVYSTNQPQQIYYQPRVGEVRPQRPFNPDPGAPQGRFPSQPFIPEPRHPSPQIIPDTVVTPPARNDWSLRDGSRVTNSHPGGQQQVTRDAPTDRRPQQVIRQGQGHPPQRMEVIDSRTPTPGAHQDAEPSRRLGPEDSGDNAPKRKPSPGGDNENADDDDDDVVMDRDKVDEMSPVPSKTLDALRPESARGESPVTRGDSPASVNSNKNSVTPSPVPPADITDRPGSAVKVEGSGEPPGEKLNVPSPAPSPQPSSNAASPAPSPQPPSNAVSPTPSPQPPSNAVTPAPSPLPEDKSRDASRSDSRLGDAKGHLVSHPEEVKRSVESLTKIDVEDNADASSDKRSESRASSIQSSRSPVPPRTPDHLATLSVPGSASPHGSPTSPKSPKSPKSSQGSVKGFDNGQLRSLSPKSPSTPSASPASPNSPKSPVPTSAGDAGEKKKTTFAESEERQAERMANAEDAKAEGQEKTRPMTPGIEARGKPPTPSKVSERAQTPGTPDGRKSSMKRSTSGRSIKSDAGSDSGANQANQGAPTTNGVSVSPTKKAPSKSREGEKRTTAASPVKSPSKSVKSLPRTPEAGPPSTADKKKVPMNKVQVGAAPSPNLKTVRSKIGSLDNASYKPGGGKVKIENRKLDFSKAQPKIAAKNDKYMPSGGDKKITQVKLQWNAKPKVGSLDNATYKPGGGDKKIETVKLDFKDKAKPKVGSKDNAKHVPGGGTVKSSATPPKTPQDPPPNDIETQKIDIKAESKIGSLDNVKHKPGGGDKKIFNDRDYLRQTGSNVESLNGSGAQIKSPGVAERPSFIEMKSNPPEPNPPPTTPTRSRPSSAMSPVTPRALRTSLEAKTPDSPTSKRVSIAEESPSSARKNATRPKTPSSAGSSRPPSSLDLKSAKSPMSSRKSSPNGLHLPKLTSNQSPDNSNESSQGQNSPKIKLPKLLETSKLSNRIEQTQ